MSSRQYEFSGGENNRPIASSGLQAINGQTGAWITSAPDLHWVNA
ncbi:MAG TPA: hypothetical protein PKE55_14830 [Kiritimatiellia bacterium]|nr:hypothetical protein [Kiritimatiellia bacterium]